MNVDFALKLSNYNIIKTFYMSQMNPKNVLQYFILLSLTTIHCPLLTLNFNIKIYFEVE